MTNPDKADSVTASGPFGGASDLHVLSAETAPHLVTLQSGDVVPISPLTLGKLPPFASAMAPLLSALASESFNTQTLLTLACTEAERVRAALAVGSGLPDSRIRELSLEDAWRIGEGIWQANQDFFVRRLKLPGPARPPPSDPRSDPLSTI